MAQHDKMVIINSLMY